MAEAKPVKFEFDTKMLDVFTEQLERLLDAYDGARLPADQFAGGVRDLITVTRKVPRSVTLNVGLPDA